ncbi:MAG: DUF3782 domain-containing protein [Alphaproteobacteria bacterium]|nr:DUF3782 domain-containing protein [Alphaproteobacteria bacterium]
MDERLEKLIEFDERLAARIEEMREHIDLHIAENKARSAELDRRYGSLSERISQFTIGMVAPAMKRLFAERNIPVHSVHREVEARADGKSTEFDLLVVNADYVVGVEVKSRLKVSDVNEHLARMADFKLYFPEYGPRIVYGAVAGMVIDEDAGKYAYRRGLYVVGQSGDTVTVLNDDSFRPQAW